MSIGARHAQGCPRVAVTGMGSVSCLGPGNAALHDGLRRRRHGLRVMEGYTQLGMRARVGGPVDLAGLAEPPRKLRRFLSPPSLYGWHAAQEALLQAGLAPERLSREDCGLVLGGGAAFSEYEAALHSHRTRGIEKISPFIVPRGMSSALSAGLAHGLGIGGFSLTVSAACTSAAQAIGLAYDLIRTGRQSIVVTGGAEELHDSTAMCFDAMGVLSPAHDPLHAARPYDRDRNGFVLAAGAGILVLESLDHAQARGAEVLAEVLAYGHCTDAAYMVEPSAQGIARALRQVLTSPQAWPDYINTHACATPQGDLAEWQAIATVAREQDVALPPLSSIKGLTGHAPAAAGALDAIACLLMMQHDLLAAGAPIQADDAAFAGMPLLRENETRRLSRVLSTNFGFGGGCTALLFARPDETAYGAGSTTYRSPML